METVVTAVAVISCLAYGCLIISFIIGNTALSSSKFKANVTPAVRFSIIVPFRNEAANLKELLESLIALEYNKNLYEVLFVNDASEDASVKIIKASLAAQKELNYRILNNRQKTGSPKKDAITAAVSTANFEWIVTTDADCSLPATWLKSFNQCILEKEPLFIAGPVAYTSENKFISNFETLDFLSLMGSTMGGFGIKMPFLCNGANLAYQKETFIKLNGFSDNQQIASGDDIFMLEKIRKVYPEKLVFLKQTEAIVITSPQGTFKRLFSQRVRWATKASAYKNGFALLTGVVVFVMNLLLLTLAFLALLKSGSINLLLGLYLVKFNLDFILLYQTAKFFKQEKLLKTYFLSSLLYPIFNVLVAIRSFFGGYQWKGRHFKK
jgi:biofilm PGA synthesis N-glycosyltransferase PgaC